MGKCPACGSISLTYGPQGKDKKQEVRCQNGCTFVRTVAVQGGELVETVGSVVRGAGAEAAAQRSAEAAAKELERSVAGVVRQF